MAKLKLKKVVDKLEDVPEAYRDSYDKRDDGKFYLDSDHEDVTSLRSALEHERTQRREAKEALKEFEEIRDELKALGEEGDLKTIVANRRKAKEDADRKAGDFDKVKEQLVREHEKVVAKLNGRVEKLLATVEELTIDAEATRLITEAKGSVPLLLPVVKAQAKAKENEQGKFVPVVFDANGTPRISDAHGTPMGIKGLIEELRTSQEYGRAFEGSGVGGSGAPAQGGSGGAGGKQYKTLKDFATDQEKSQFIKDHGLEAFKQIAAASVGTILDSTVKDMGGGKVAGAA
jgi:hypothetical protein